MLTDVLQLLKIQKCRLQHEKVTPKTQTILEINKALRQLTALKYVTIQWVPSHVGIHGNDVADLQGKNGTTLYKSNQTLEAHEAIKKKKPNSK
jgi:ribonuclease HI